MNSRSLKREFITLENSETLSYFDTKSSKRVIVLLHGNMSSLIFLSDIIEDLEKDFRVIALDMRGFGYSSYKSTVNSFFDLADDLYFFLGQLNISMCSIAGWSTGGGVGICFGIKYPDKLESLILIGCLGLEGYPQYKIGPDGKKTNQRIKSREEISEDVKCKIILKSFQNKEIDVFKYSMTNAIYSCSNPTDSMLENLCKETLLQKNFIDIMYCLLNFNVLKLEDNLSINKLVCPVLIIHGQKDKVINISEAIKISKTLPTLSTLKIYQNSGHTPFFDERERFVKDIKMFLLPKSKF